jgi:hypothetical protein
LLRWGGVSANHVPGLRSVGKLNAFSFKGCVYLEVDALLDFHVYIVVARQHVADRLEIQRKVRVLHEVQAVEPSSNPALCMQLIKKPPRKVAFLLMARPARFELTTPAFGGQYSIQLSYGRMVIVRRVV